MNRDTLATIQSPLPVTSRRARWITTQLSNQLFTDNNAHRLPFKIHQFSYILKFIISLVWCHLSYCVISSWSSHVSPTFTMFSFYHSKTYSKTWIYFIYIYPSCLEMTGVLCNKCHRFSVCSLWPRVLWQAVTLCLVNRIAQSWHLGRTGV